MIKAIIFDCFGVIRTDAWDDTYRAFGGDPDKDRQFIIDVNYDSSTGKLPEGSATVMAEHFGITAEEWRSKFSSFGGIDEELVEYIQTLREKYKIGMLSNIGKGGFSRFFEKGYLEQNFDVAIASSDIGYAKPEAQSYEIAADKLGVRLDESIFVDDRQDYIDGAQGVGMKTILYKNFEDFKTQLEKLLV